MILEVLGGANRALLVFAAILFLVAGFWWVKTRGGGRGEGE
jgi:hypothetical protein